MIISDHPAVKGLTKVGERHPRVRYWMGFISANQFKLEYRQDPRYANENSLSTFPVEITQMNIEGESRLSRPDDAHHSYFVGVSGLCSSVVSPDSELADCDPGY